MDLFNSVEVRLYKDDFFGIRIVGHDGKLTQVKGKSFDEMVNQALFKTEAFMPDYETALEMFQSFINDGYLYVRISSIFERYESRRYTSLWLFQSIKRLCFDHYREQAKRYDYKLCGMTLLLLITDIRDYYAEQGFTNSTQAN